MLREDSLQAQRKDQVLRPEEVGRKGYGPYGQRWQDLHEWDGEGEAELVAKTWSRKAQDESIGRRKEYFPGGVWKVRSRKGT